jgi:hypothetical protein
MSFRSDGNTQPLTNQGEMKITSIIKTAIAATAFLGAAASAQTFTYTPGDLFAAFRKAGSPDLIVDLGQASLYQQYGAAPFSITGVNSTLLDSVFGNMDGISWSVFGYVNTSGSSLGPQNTIWVTDPRSDITTPNDPNSSLTFSAQGQTISKMEAIVAGATSGYATVLANQIVQVANSLNVGGDPVSYTVGVGSLGDFRGTWRPNIENLTPTGFAASSTPEVSDLFQQNPGAANVGSYLGDFQLGNDGGLTFSPVPEPSTLAMLGAGMMTLVAIRRFGRKQQP